LASESPYSLYEKVNETISGSDILYKKELIPSHTWQYSIMGLENLPIIDIKSVSINEEWINTIKITSGDSFYQLGKFTEPYRDTNTEWIITNSGPYNIDAAGSYINDGVIKNINKELKYIVDPNTLVYHIDDLGRPLGTTRIPFGKTYKCKFTSPLNIDILYLIHSNSQLRFLITSHPELFNNSTCVMRINKMDINFQEQVVEFECFIYEIRSNSNQVDFTLWFDSPFQDYTDKIQDNMNNGNDGDWYVGIL
jgi:hypothetical protein